MKKQKVFVVIQHGSNKEEYFYSVNVVGVFRTKTAAKERAEEKKAEILDYYNEEYPDCYEVTENEDEASWCCSCVDNFMYDELLITETIIDEED